MGRVRGRPGIPSTPSKSAWCCQCRPGKEKVLPLQWLPRPLINHVSMRFAMDFSGMLGSDGTNTRTASQCVIICLVPACLFDL